MLDTAVLASKILADAADLLATVKEERGRITLDEAHRLRSQLREAQGWIASGMEFLTPGPTEEGPG